MGIYPRLMRAPWVHTKSAMLWLLTRTTDCRIFKNLSVPDIVSTVFQDYPGYNFNLRLQGTYDPRGYTVRYRETDFNFVFRLLTYINF